MTLNKKEGIALKEYDEALKDEGSLPSQKAKVDWISKGDRNNQFLGASKDVNNQKDFKGVFGTKLNNVEAIDMVREITNLEIKNAMFNIGDNKAPGPDGYASTFYKKAWKIVGKDVCMAIKEFFNTGKFLGEMNATLISLVPKVSTQNKVSDYRPIACCNVVYKCISKILTDRIKPGYDSKNGPSRCCLKIDIVKAYDTVDWKFLKKSLVHFGFHEKMIKWIMVCVTTAKFSIYLNGERKGYFSSGREACKVQISYRMARIGTHHKLYASS
ncbi:RNA-directed DNA polymerase, eukaryota, reverse transcriptase zinc-binding domain protein [Tanacetum coccineum]